MSAVVLLVALAATTHAPIDCVQRPAACSRALRWQREQRARDAQRQWRLARPTLAEAASIAGRVYGVDPAAMLRVSQCEIRGHYHPTLRYVSDANPRSGATGPWQFLSSTWSHTPWASWPRSDVYVQALATAQIVAHDGSWRQWDCKP